MVGSSPPLRENAVLQRAAALVRDADRGADRIVVGRASRDDAGNEEVVILSEGSGPG